MSTCHEHNLRTPLPDARPYGIRVRLRRGDPFAKLVGEDWSKEHWYASARERDAALREMSGRYAYFRPGDQPALEFEAVER